MHFFDQAIQDFNETVVLKDWWTALVDANVKLSDQVRDVLRVGYTNPRGVAKMREGPDAGFCFTRINVKKNCFDRRFIPAADIFIHYRPLYPHPGSVVVGSSDITE